MKHDKDSYRGKVIIINDRPSVGKRLARRLTEMGYHYTFVQTVDEAADLLEHADFDVVLYTPEFPVVHRKAYIAS